MKKFKKLATLLLTIALVLSVSACLPDLSKISSSEQGGNSGSAQPTYEYSLNLTSFSIDVGAERTLRIIAEPEKEDIVAEWESDNEAVATVENGTVTGVAEGIAIISATVDGQTLECEVTVNALPITYEYSLDKTSGELTIGEDLQLNVIVTPEKEDGVSVQWSSTANSVATVDANGLVKAVGVGSATITAIVEESTLTCEITVSSPVSATAVVAERADANLTDNHESLDTLYWEHYSDAGERSKLFASKDYITTNLFDVCPGSFGDFKIPLSYNDGVGNLAYERNTNGKHTPNGETASIEFVIAIDEHVKAIRVYTGVWNATNTVTLEWNGTAIATAESFTAGGDSLGREVTFTIDQIDASITELTLRVSASGVSGGNVSAPAVVILGNAPAKESAVSVEYTKSEMPNMVEGNPANEYFLTELGTQDWIYLNKHDIVRKNGGSMILTDTLEVEGNSSFDDYKGTFAWTDGDTIPVSSGINNDGQFGSWASIQTKVNADTNRIYFWVGGYSSTYYFEAYDSKGNLLVHDLLHEEEVGVTHSFMIELAVNTTAEEVIMLNIYRTGGANCSIAALAIHKDVEYTYALEQSEIELQANTTWEAIKVSATPDRRFAVSYEVANQEIATVDANGVVTGVSEGETAVKVLIDGKDVGLVANVKVTPAPVEYTYELISALEMMPSQERQIAVVITPVPTEAPAVVWTSNYPDIVRVENGLLTAIVDGEATITAEVEGQTLTCVVTVATKATATVTTTPENPYEVSLTDNDAVLDTLYWEHYAGTDTHASKKEDIIEVTPGGSFFGDFGIRFRWFDGTGSKIVENHSREGSHTSGTHVVEAQIAVTPAVKAIRVYAGAWRGTNTVSLLLNGMTLATAEPFTADWTSTGREITFNVDIKENLTLTLKVEGSNVEGNVSLNAIVVLGNENREQAVASLSMQKTSLILNDGERKDINLTEIGNLDWFVPETNLVDGDPWDIDEKAGANYIDSSAFRMSFYNWYGDFGYDRVFFNWSDGTNFPVIGTDRDRNDGRWGSIASVTTKVDASVKHVYLWISGWNCSYNMAVMDSKNNIIFDEEIVQAQGNNQPFELNFAVNCATEETLTFVLYGTSSDNCSIVAMAVSGIEDYDYVANIGEATLFEEETATLTITSSPAKDLHVEYASSAPAVATVDEYGVITALSAGSAIITATVDGKEFTCAVTVNERPVEYAYTLNVEQKELIKGETLELVLSVSPSKELVCSYLSTDEAIAQVDDNGLVTAMADGTVRIDVLVDGVIVASCNLTIDTPVTAGEVSVANGDGATVELSTASETHTTLYWERYRDNREVVSMINAEDMIPTNTMPELGGGFGDYKAQINWINGNTVTSWMGNTSGLCYGGQTVATINVTPSVKQIIVYTGAWNASVYATLSLNGVAIATSETFEAGGTGIARFVNFNLTVKEATTLTLTLNPTSSSGGNASLTAIAILGDARATTTALTLEKELLPAEFVTVDDKSQPSVSYDLTALGTIDWLYTNFENQGTDEKVEGTAIDTASLKWDGGGKFWDYKAIFTFSNGEKWDTTAGEGKSKDSDTTHGTNNGICGAWVNVNVKVDANTNNVHLFVGGYQSTYYIMAIDSNGSIIHHEMLSEGTS